MSVIHLAKKYLSCCRLNGENSEVALESLQRYKENLSSVEKAQFCTYVIRSNARFHHDAYSVMFDKKNLLSIAHQLVDTRKAYKRYCPEYELTSEMMVEIAKQRKTSEFIRDYTMDEHCLSMFIDPEYHNWMDLMKDSGVTFSSLSRVISHEQVHFSALLDECQIPKIENLKEVEDFAKDISWSQQISVTLPGAIFLAQAGFPKEALQEHAPKLSELDLKVLYALLKVTQDSKVICESMHLPSVRSLCEFGLPIPDDFFESPIQNTKSTRI